MPAGPPNPMIQALLARAQGQPQGAPGQPAMPPIMPQAQGFPQGMPPPGGPPGMPPGGMSGQPPAFGMPGTSPGQPMMMPGMPHPGMQQPPPPNREAILHQCAMMLQQAIQMSHPTDQATDMLAQMQQALLMFAAGQNPVAAGIGRGPTTMANRPPQAGQPMDSSGPPQFPDGGPRL